MRRKVSVANSRAKGGLDIAFSGFVRTEKRFKWKPFFSVILPTFNRADLLPFAIDTVIRQTLKSWELIIINDGSTDGTEEIIRKYQDADARIRAIHQSNQGAAAARCVFRPCRRGIPGDAGAGFARMSAAD